MNAEILSIGTEVTRGAVVDTNAAWLAEQLSALGVDVRRHTAVGDRHDDIESAFAAACELAEVVVITGGLGPTLDDVTREVVARAGGLPLARVDDEVERIRDFFRRRGRELPESNLRQAMVPRGARVLPNACGTACGFWLDLKDTAIIALPGIPAEMTAMFSDGVLPELRKRIGDCGVAVRKVQTYGMPESTLGGRLRDLMVRGANPDVGTRLQLGTITVRILARGANRPEAETLAETTAAEVRRRLGDAVFGSGEQRLEEAVAALLVGRQCTIALAESCTGGLAASLLTNVPGVSQVLVEAVVTYGNDSKVRRLGVDEALIRDHGAVSPEVAQAMAEGIRSTSGAELGVGITGVAGPAGGTPDKPVGLVYVALADGGETIVQELRLGGNRRQIRERAATAALNAVRLQLGHQEQARSL